jgi:hypothetical protein
VTEIKMKLFKVARSFGDDEAGAVTVDWVVLTAAVVGLGVAALSAIRSGTQSLTSKIEDHLKSVTISTTF